LARRRFFVDELVERRAVVRGERARHLCRVLRVQPGQVFELAYNGRLYLGRVTAARPSAVEFAAEEELASRTALPEITMLAAIFKYDRMEWMLEKATELGVAKIVPVIAARTQPSLARAAAKRVERWRRIVGEAAQQSRRIEPPAIPGPLPFKDALALAAGRRLMLDEASRRAWPAVTDAGTWTLLVGPEGGWTDSERSLAAASGFSLVSMGPLILRAETAAIAALGALMLTRSADDQIAEGDRG
jgi:16S rRNA (uracil1498-N3)-methyltransferase